MPIDDTAAAPRDPELDDHDGDEEEEGELLFGITINENADMYFAQLSMKLSDAKMAKMATMMIEPKTEEMRLKVPAELREQVSLHVTSDDAHLLVEVQMSKAVWKSADDQGKTMVASQAKLALSQALRGLALFIEANDLFSLGKVSISTFTSSLPTPPDDTSN